MKTKNLKDLLSHINKAFEEKKIKGDINEIILDFQEKKKKNLQKTKKTKKQE